MRRFRYRRPGANRPLGPPDTPSATLNPPTPLPPGSAARRGALLAGLLWLAGCAAPLPAVQWLRLPAQAPEALPATPAAGAAAQAGPALQLVGAVGLPGHLDRSALLVPQGGASLQPLGTTRWAEPLRDAVPRLLRADLALLLDAPVWASPLPPGVLTPVQLRMELQALDVAPDLRSVRLQARWSLADPQGVRPPSLHEASFDTPAAANDADTLARAHRQALWTLARQVAASTAAWR
jgi:uncharacterized protein